MKKEELNKKEPEIIPNKEQEYLEGWKRARADLENFQKRMADNRMQEYAVMKRNISENLIALNDNFKALTDHAPEKKDAWVEGVLHIARQFDQTLQEFGIETIEETGQVFDPSIHEAVEEVDGEEGKVIEIVQAGYKVGDMTIRPAKVKVGKFPSPKLGEGGGEGR